MYEPYKYPPNLQLAKLHRDCTRPGDENPAGRLCPCCDAQEKRPIKNWFRRNIRQDFSHYGGAVVTYFSLLKFYAASMFVILCMYSVFQAICIRDACQAERASDPNSKICVEPLGFWVVSTQDLTTIMKRHDQLAGRVVTLLVLRGATFVLLVVVNLVSLYVVSNQRSQRLTQEKPGLRHFTLFFKNVPKKLSEDDLRAKIGAIDENINIKDVFFVNKTNRYKKAYDQKIQSYFKLQSKLKTKERQKEIKKLEECIKQLRELNKAPQQRSGRAIVTFSTVSDLRRVQNYYKLSFLDNIRQKLDLRGTNERMYVDPMPKPEEIFWQYLGKESHQKVQMKIVTFLLMVGCLGASYLLLGAALKFGDLDFKNSIPIVKQIWTTFLALVVVALALIFRQIMNFLSELRHPNTQTSKTMFIVCTTVIYHFIYFLIAPTIFFLLAKKEEKSLQLHSISYQALNFVIVQLILAGFDIFYCCWASNSTKLLNNPDSGLCQKQLHDKVTAPRFPMQFKLIILFKSWSFVTFYAFETPYILLVIFLTFLFLLFNDKKNLYQHYRMEMIDYRVQRLFLSIYTNFFIAYMCFIFVLTQNLTIQFPLAIALSALAVILQVSYAIQDKRDKHIKLDVSLDEINYEKSYRELYQSYLASMNNPELDRRIEEYTEQVTRKKSLASGADSMTEALIE